MKLSNFFSRNKTQESSQWASGTARSGNKVGKKGSSKVSVFESLKKFILPSKSGKPRSDRTIKSRAPKRLQNPQSYLGQKTSKKPVTSDTSRPPSLEQSLQQSSRSGSDYSLGSRSDSVSYSSFLDTPTDSQSRVTSQSKPDIPNTPPPQPESSGERTLTQSGSQQYQDQLPKTESGSLYSSSGSGWDDGLDDLYGPGAATSFGFDSNGKRKEDLQTRPTPILGFGENGEIKPPSTTAPRRPAPPVPTPPVPTPPPVAPTLVSSGFEKSIVRPEAPVTHVSTPPESPVPSRQGRSQSEPVTGNNQGKSSSNQSVEVNRQSVARPQSQRTSTTPRRTAPPPPSSPKGQQPQKTTSVESKSVTSTSEKTVSKDQYLRGFAKAFTKPTLIKVTREFGRKVQDENISLFNDLITAAKGKVAELEAMSDSEFRAITGFEKGSTEWKQARPGFQRELQKQAYDSVLKESAGAGYTVMLDNGVKTSPADYADDFGIYFRYLESEGFTPDLLEVPEVLSEAQKLIKEIESKTRGRRNTLDKELGVRTPVRSRERPPIAPKPLNLRKPSTVDQPVKTTVAPSHTGQSEVQKTQTEVKTTVEAKQRSPLLSEIENPTIKLRKTQTNDRSAPQLSRRTDAVNNGVTNPDKPVPPPPPPPPPPSAPPQPPSGSPKPVSDKASHSTQFQDSLDQINSGALKQGLKKVPQNEIHNASEPKLERKEEGREPSKLERMFAESGALSRSTSLQDVSSPDPDTTEEIDEDMESSWAEEEEDYKANEYQRSVEQLMKAKKSEQTSSTWRTADIGAPKPENTGAPVEYRKSQYEGDLQGILNSRRRAISSDREELKELQKATEQSATDLNKAQNKPTPDVELSNEPSTEKTVSTSSVNNGAKVESEPAPDSTSSKKPYSAEQLAQKLMSGGYKGSQWREQLLIDTRSIAAVNGQIDELKGMLENISPDAMTQLGYSSDDIEWMQDNLNGLDSNPGNILDDPYRQTIDVRNGGS
ncbi:WH2 domain-containing protein [Endozoicomonadaceae bacterium StTr2]